MSLATDFADKAKRVRGLRARVGNKSKSAKVKE